MEKCAKKKKKTVERKKKGLDRASIVRDGRFSSVRFHELRTPGAPGSGLGNLGLWVLR
jgi:hypothetical protein